MITFKYRDSSTRITPQSSIITKLRLNEPFLCIPNRYEISSSNQHSNPKAYALKRSSNGTLLLSFSIIAGGCATQRRQRITVGNNVRNLRRQGALLRLNNDQHNGNCRRQPGADRRLDDRQRNGGRSQERTQVGVDWGRVQR